MKSASSDDGPWNNFQERLRQKHNGAVAWGSSGPLREGKGSIYEGGLRIPCIIRWPERIPAGRVNDAIFSTLDVMPTLANLTGFEVPEDRIIDGVDQTGLLLGKSERGARDHYYYFSGNQMHAVRQGKWKLVLTGRTDFPGYVKDRGTSGYELYDLESDIGEKNNVAVAHPATAEKLKALAGSFEWPDALYDNAIRPKTEEPVAFPKR